MIFDDNKKMIIITIDDARARSAQRRCAKRSAAGAHARAKKKNMRSEDDGARSKAQTRYYRHAQNIKHAPRAAQQWRARAQKR